VVAWVCFTMTMKWNCCDAVTCMTELLAPAGSASTLFDDAVVLTGMMPLFFCLIFII